MIRKIIRSLKVKLMEPDKAGDSWLGLVLGFVAILGTLSLAFILEVALLPQR